MNCHTTRKNAAHANRLPTEISFFETKDFQWRKDAQAA